MPTPQRPRRAPAPTPSKPFPVVQLALSGVVLLVGIGAVLWILLTGKEPEKPKPLPPPPATKPASKPASKPTGSLVKDLPPEIRKEIYDRLAKYSDRVDGLEKQEQAVEKESDAQKRLDGFREVQDAYSECAEGILEVLDDPKYEKWRKSEEYGPNFAGYEQRLKYYTSKMNMLKKKVSAAYNEVQVEKEKAKEGNK